ncbi:MAG: SpoIIE family protein phosphatase [Crocinitomicaceae bacterium]|nr:SpoIIE family protein phosphatase [Crocinitomicaceae bacterium]
MKRLLSIVLVLFPILLSAQQFYFKKYSLEEGLSRSGVFHIMQDKAGFLWIATEGGGVCKFDGRKFTIYTRQNGLASENVEVIFQDDREVIWFGTYEGLSYFDGRSFHTLTIEDGLADDYIKSITQDSKGNIWVCTSKGISIIDPDEKGISGEFKFSFNLPQTKVRSVLAQGDIVWIGTDRGIVKYQNEQIIQYTEEDGLRNELVLCMFVDSKENLWVGTQGGLSKFHGDSIENWDIMDGLLHNRVRSITEDRYGKIWIGTTSGISIFDGKEFQSITEENGLSNERIRYLTSDSFHNVWVGTFFGGVMRFNHQDFISYTPQEGLVSNQILAINEDAEGNIIVGTYDGVSTLQIMNGRLEGSSPVDLQNGLYTNSVRAVFKDELNRYWYGTNRGLSVVTEDQIIQINEANGMKNTEVTVIKKFNRKYWIGTRRGIAIIEDDILIDSLQVEFIDQESGIAGEEVSNIVQDPKGRIWVSFADGKISLFEKDKFINPVFPGHTSEILSMSLDSSGRVWLGTNGSGIYYGNYIEETQKFDLKHITTSEGLVSNTIYSILILKNTIWTGHENGLNLLTLDADSISSIKSFGSEDGFFGMQNNQNSSFVDSKGNLWFGTVDGLFCLKNTEIKQFTDGTPSINYISSVRIDGESINWDESEWCSGTSGAYNLPDNLVLPYNENNVSFEFIGLNFVSPKKIKYSWKLEGFDENWCAPTSKNFATYTNLPPGTYSFLLRSSNEHGVISGEKISFEFTIEKPFWSTWAFRITAGILAALLIWGIMRLRTRQLLRQRKALENVIQERTKEIRQQKDELAIKNKEVTDSIQYSKRIQGSILPGKEKLRSLLEKHFILFKPKDIVSGDFYWAEKNHVNPNIRYFAAADCTGHGVPGAMVSLIGTRALSASVHEAKLMDTNDILDATKRIVVEAFTDAESGEIIKDGMDIALCALDYSNSNNVRFQFSGAQNPVWIVRPAADTNIEMNGSEVLPDIIENGFKLYELKGDKQPIGYFEDSQPFHRYEGYLKPGDRIYVFTDGFADQFGGDKGKKFKYKTLKQLILSAQKSAISEQKSICNSAFYDWKGDIEQVDDICLIGVEV